MSCPVLLLLAQNLRYAWRVLTVVCSAASLAPWSEHVPDKSFWDALLTKSHVCASRSAARKTFPSTDVIGSAIVCTRIRRWPEVVVYSRAHCTYASWPSCNFSSNRKCAAMVLSQSSAGKSTSVGVRLQ